MPDDTIEFYIGTHHSVTVVMPVDVYEARKASPAEAHKIGPIFLFMRDEYFGSPERDWEPWLAGPWSLMYQLLEGHRWATADLGVPFSNPNLEMASPETLIESLEAIGSSKQLVEYFGHPVHRRIAARQRETAPDYAGWPVAAL